MPPKKADQQVKRARRILVVDDNVDLAKALARFFEILGHDAQIAHDAPSALETARRSMPEFLLLDIGLPGIDGYQLATQIRRDENLKGATLVAISGYDGEDDRERSRQAGFDHHLVKPVDHGELIKLLNELE